MSESLLKKEATSIWKDKKVTIAIFAVFTIPILYAGMFLWAFWDPYTYLDSLPIAVVNEDTGATFEGEKLELGDELVEKLEEEAIFDFHFVDTQTGYKGLQNEDYYVLIEIPRNFSEHATTLLDDNPEKMQLTYVPNESYNFLAAQMGETAMLEIETALEEKVIETYADAMFDSVHELADGFATAHDGSSELYDGTVELADGVVELQDGSGKLADGTNELHDGMNTLAEKSGDLKNGLQDASSGAGTLTNGIHELNDGLGLLLEGQQTLMNGSAELESGANTIATNLVDVNAGLEDLSTGMDAAISGANELSEGATSLSDNMNAWESGAEGAKAGAEQVHAGITQLEQELQPLLAYLPEEEQQKAQAQLAALVEGSGDVANGVAELQENAGQLSAGADNVATGASSLSAGQQEIQAGIGALQEGGTALQEGAQTLASGQSELTEGMVYFNEQLATAQSGVNQLATGSETLVSGLGELTDGAGQFEEGSSELASGAFEIKDGMGALTEGVLTLADGSQQLTDGSGELADKLGEAADESAITTSEKNSQMMSNPVLVEQAEINEVPNYGTGFAPYFLSLGLFVGALLLSIVYPMRTAADTPRNAFQWFASKGVMLIGVGIIQALIACGILLWGLGLEVQSVPLFLTFAIITSITFISLIQFFVTAFDNPGRFIAILILIFQLTTSAGTFPLELIPESLQTVNLFLPMTYTVSGFKAVISSGDFSVMWQNAGVLFGFIALFVAGTITYFAIQLRKGKGEPVEVAESI